MLLIGMLDSPFVRRVAISMRMHGLAYEHGNWSVGRDFERIRQYSPLGRVPVLVLDDRSVLIESAAILDYLDQQVGVTRALLPVDGPQRRQCLQIMAIAIGAAESARDAIYERLMRPADKLHQPWLDRRLSQAAGALAELEVLALAAALRLPEWMVGNHMTQADITLACCYTFIADALPLAPETPYTALRTHVARCEELPEFLATRVPWFAPGKS